MKETKRLGGKIVFMGGTDKQNEKFAEAFMEKLPQGLADAELREQKKEEAMIRRWEREAEKKKLKEKKTESAESKRLKDIMLDMNHRLAEVEEKVKK